MLEELVLGLLDPEIRKTTEQVIEEFRMEYPGRWKQLEKEGETLYGSSCSSIQQPATRISQVLLSLPTDRCICLRRNNEYFWNRRLKNQL